MERDVDRADRRLDAAPLGDERAQPVRERDAARVDPDEGEPPEVVVALDQLVRQPRERPRQGVCVEDLARRARARVSRWASLLLLPGLAGPA